MRTMKFKLKKRKNTTEAIIAIMTEDQRVVGVIGIVEDLMRAQLVAHIEGEEAPEDEKQKWLLAFENRQFLGETKEDLLKLLRKTGMLEAEND